jgi:hypothetical protein
MMPKTRRKQKRKTCSNFLRHSLPFLNLQKTLTMSLTKYPASVSKGAYSCNDFLLLHLSFICIPSFTQQQTRECGIYGFSPVFSSQEHRYFMSFICHCPQYRSHMLFIFQANQWFVSVSMSKYQSLCQ